MWNDSRTLLPKRLHKTTASVDTLVKFENRYGDTCIGVGFVLYDSGEWYVRDEDGNGDETRPVTMWAYFDMPKEIMHTIPIDGE